MGSIQKYKSQSISRVLCPQRIPLFTKEMDSTTSHIRSQMTMKQSRNTKQNLGHFSAGFPKKTVIKESWIGHIKTEF